MAWEITGEPRKRQYHFRNGLEITSQEFWDGFWWWLVLDSKGRLLYSFRNYDRAYEYAKNYKTW